MSSHAHRPFKQAGFSIVEIMVAVGILGIVVLGTMSAVEIGLKGQAAVEQKYSVVNLQNHIYSLLENSGVCAANFGTGANQKNANLFTGNSTINISTGLRDIAGTVHFGVFDASTQTPTYESGTIRISSMKLQNFQHLSGIEGQMELAVGIERNKEAYGSNTFRPRIIKLKVNLAGPYDTSLATPNYISSCIAFGGNADQIWSKNANNTIFYNGANVGIGTSAPAHRLEIDAGTAMANIGYMKTTGVAGSLSFGFQNPQGASALGVDAQGNAMIMGQSGTGVGLYTNAINIPKMLIASNGNVGIGTTAPSARLEVAGGIRPGSETAVTTCDSTTEGTMRYNYSAHAMQFCGASGSTPPLTYAWSSMGGSGSSDAGQPCNMGSYYGTIIYGNWANYAIQRLCCRSNVYNTTQGNNPSFGSASLYCFQY